MEKEKITLDVYKGRKPENLLSLPWLKTYKKKIKPNKNKMRGKRRKVG